MKNINEITEILSKVKGADDFSAIQVTTNSYELFFVRGKLETVRFSESVKTQATVFSDHDGKRGSAVFGVFEGENDGDISAKASKAVEKARLIFDEPYSLPCGDKAESGVIESNLNGLSEKEIAYSAAEAVERACESVKENYPDTAVNALEVFVTTQIRQVKNSRGIDKTERKRTLSIEAIPTYGTGSESVELFETYTFGELDLSAITEELRARLIDVAERKNAALPKEKLRCPVILNPYESRTLFEELTGDIGFGRMYLRQNLHAVGDSLQSAPEGDKINVTMRGAIKGCAKSALFDADGTELKDVKIIEDGKIIAGFGSHRFAEYLGKTPTGALGCIEVGAGSRSAKELVSVPHLECVYLSGLQVDLYNDYIGGEIRLAYYFDGEKRVPITGIAMSGKLSEVLNTVKLSKERALCGAYFGPEKISIENMEIF